jgi:hypothetical protein
MHVRYFTHADRFEPCHLSDAFEAHRKEVWVLLLTGEVCKGMDIGRGDWIIYRKDEDRLCILRPIKIEIRSIVVRDYEWKGNGRPLEIELERGLRQVHADAQHPAYRHGATEPRPEEDTYLVVGWALIAQKKDKADV